MIDDIIQIQKIQTEAENGNEESVFRLKRKTRDLIPGEDSEFSSKKRRKTETSRGQEQDKTAQSEDIVEIVNPEGDIINNTLATLAAALVWLALQSDELVSNRKYAKIF